MTVNKNCVLQVRPTKFRPMFSRKEGCLEAAWRYCSVPRPRHPWTEMIMIAAFFCDRPSSVWDHTGMARRRSISSSLALWNTSCCGCRAWNRSQKQANLSDISSGLHPQSWGATRPESSKYCSHELNFKTGQSRKSSSGPRCWLSTGTGAARPSSLNIA